MLCGYSALIVRSSCFFTLRNQVNALQNSSSLFTARHLHISLQLMPRDARAIEFCIFLSLLRIEGNLES